MIDTRVKGSAASVDSAASWLRDSLKTRVDDASEDVIAAKRKAERHWEGRAGTAYVGYVKEIITVTDAHVERIETAAGKVEAYSSRLRQAKDRMRALRDEARGGGLDVVDTVIQAPADAVAPTSSSLDATDREAQGFAHDLGTFQAQVDKIELYNRILADVEREWSSFVAWIDSHLKSVPRELEAPDVDGLIDVIRENVGKQRVAFALTYGNRTLLNTSALLTAAATELRGAKRSGNPARRARGRAPDVPHRIKTLDTFADWTGKGGKVLGPAGWAWDTYQALENESPGGALLGAAAGTFVTAAIIGTAPAVVPTVVVVAGAVAVGVGLSCLVSKGWDQIPDDYSDPVDNWIGEQWDGTKDDVSDGWNTVKGWF